MADDLGDNWWETERENFDAKSGSAEDDDGSIGGQDLPSHNGSPDGQDFSDHDGSPVGQDLSDTEGKAVANKTSKSVAASLQKSTPKAKKRKGEKKTQKADRAEEPPAKKSKRKNITEELSKEVSRPATVDDFQTALTKHYTDRLSALEWDDVKLDETHFTACRDLNHDLGAHLKVICPSWKRVVKSMKPTPGAPLVLVICSAAMRAVDLIRLLNDFKGPKCKAAKLFAKHLKLKDQCSFLQKTVIHIGVGTPNRILALLENGALHLDQVKVALLDWTWRDCKQRRLVDIPEVREDLFSLSRKHLMPALRRGQAQLSLF